MNGLYYFVLNFKNTHWLEEGPLSKLLPNFVNSGNTMNKSFQRTDTVFQIDQVNIVTKNILELDIERSKMSWKRSV